jgi:hypothetical protein
MHATGLDAASSRRVTSRSYRPALRAGDRTARRYANSSSVQPWSSCWSLGAVSRAGGPRLRRACPRRRVATSSGQATQGAARLVVLGRSSAQRVDSSAGVVPVGRVALVVVVEEPSFNWRAGCAARGRVPCAGARRWWRPRSGEGPSRRCRALGAAPAGLPGWSRSRVSSRCPGTRPWTSAAGSCSSNAGGGPLSMLRDAVPRGAAIQVAASRAGYLCRAQEPSRLDEALVVFAGLPYQVGCASLEGKPGGGGSMAAQRWRAPWRGAGFGT